MGTERNDRIRELLLKACDLAPDARAAFLEEACAGDTGLRKEVESLLSYDRTSRQPIHTAGTETVPFVPDSSPESIGPYRILEMLGEGGMGVVYLAEQKEPIRRRVALKLIKWGMDSAQVLARFESERQALAMMNHPNIAQAFDAGRAEDGRPYFAMELVRGEPITTYCDRQRLTTEERLKLFQQVCDGVQHAHQKGIIHRDIKPSNILVTIQDFDPVPKVIDFGVAKATEQRLTERTVFTQMGALIGTPEYMSPEQAELTGLDIDTRTDVYALGVVLYELLAGARPFDASSLREAGFDEIRRMIREEEPSKPSTKLATLGDASTNAAQNRRVDPATLRRRLRGDLDWITMKALEKDRTRRYGSPQELAADIERHLTSQPVLASPPSTAYRMGKFIQRHKVGVGFAGVVLALLIGFAATMMAQAARIAAERDRANEAAALAEREAATSQRVSDFLVELFRVSNPDDPQGNTVTAREILDRGAERIQSELKDEPRVQARLSGTMGQVYIGLGLYDQASPLLRDALEIHRRVLGEEHHDTLHSMSSLAYLYVRLGRYEEAEGMHRATLEARRRALGDEHPDVVSSMISLAGVCLRLSRYEEAEVLHRDALEIRRRVLGDEDFGTIASMNWLAGIYQAQGKYAESERLYREALPLAERVVTADHPLTLAIMNNLGLLFVKQNRYEEAVDLFTETVSGKRRVQGETHPDTLTTVNNLALAYNKLGRYEEAVPLLRDTLDSSRRVQGRDYPGNFTIANNLADAYMGLGRFDDAEQILQDVLSNVTRVLPVEHVIPGTAYRTHGRCLAKMGRYTEAETSLLESHRILEPLLGDRHDETIATVEALLDLYREWDRPAEVAEWTARLNHSDL